MSERMSSGRGRQLGREDYLAFLRSRPKLALALVAGVVCVLVGLIIGTTSDSPGTELWGGSLLILGVVVLIDVGVTFSQWNRARPVCEGDVPQSDQS